MLTTVHLFRVAPAGVPAALARMALDRRHLASTPGLAFWKLLGTGAGRTFDLRDADPTRWGLLAVWAGPGALASFERRSPVARGWRRLARERWRADLALLRSRGRWSGQAPFGTPVVGGAAGAGAAVASAGPVAAVTRARLRPRRARAFCRSVPPVTADLRRRDGLLLAVGIGESPVGLQGTFSVWRDEGSMRAFAYGGWAHRAVIRRSGELGWYAEELFARFRVLQATGGLRECGPLAGG